MEDNKKTHQQLQADFEAMQQRAEAAETKLTQLESGDSSHDRWVDQLGAISQSIQSSTSLEDVWRSLSTGLEEVLGIGRTAVYSKNPDTGLVSCPYAHGITRHLRDTFQTRIVGVFNSETAVFDIPLTFKSMDEEEPIKIALTGEAIQSTVLFFLFIEKNCCGIVAVFSERAEPFSKQALSIGQMLTNIGKATIQNLHLTQEREVALQREQKWNELTYTLSSSFDLPSILQNMGRIATELIGADAGLLGLVIDNQMMIFYPHNIPLQMNLRPAAKGRGVAWDIIDTMQPVLLDSYMDHPSAQQKWVQMAIRSFIGVPVFTSDECFGALTVFNTSDKKLTKRDLALVESIGQQAGVAIQNARMLAEAKQRATALVNTLNRQEELDKLKNQFIQTVSHELRSPLGIIYGHAELLESGDLGELADIQQESINIISARVRMLTDLVDDLTALMAAETQEFRRDFINPVQLLYATVAEYRMESEEQQVEIVPEIAEMTLQIEGDLTQLRRVFDNLLSNAFKFTDEGGHITIRLWSESKKVIIEVEDTGEGIAEEHLPRIFERFYQVTDKKYRPRRKGTGLGLSLVKEIIEAHRGDVFVVSEVGVGTTFRIELPGHEEVKE